jgi:hypothetical protein
MRIQPASSFGADVAPLAQQQRATEQVRPDLDPIESPFVMFRADADQRRGVREQRQLNRHGTHRRVRERLGIYPWEMYHKRQPLGSKNRRCTRKIRRGRYTIVYSVSPVVWGEQAVKPGSMTRLEGVPASHLTIWRRPGGMGQTKKRLGIAMCRTSIA